MPEERRRRTIHFFGLPGHHNLTGDPDVEGQSGTWLAEHPEGFEKAAVLLNWSTPAQRHERPAIREPMLPRQRRGSPAKVQRSDQGARCIRRADLPGIASSASRRNQTLLSVRPRSAVVH